MGLKCTWLTKLSKNWNHTCNLERITWFRLHTYQQKKIGSTRSSSGTDRSTFLSISACVFLQSVASMWIVPKFLCKGHKSKLEKYQWKKQQNMIELTRNRSYMIYPQPINIFRYITLLKIPPTYLHSVSKSSFSQSVPILDQTSLFTQLKSR